MPLNFGWYLKSLQFSPIINITYIAAVPASPVDLFELFLTIPPIKKYFIYKKAPEPLQGPGIRSRGNE